MAHFLPPSFDVMLSYKGLSKSKVTEYIALVIGAEMYKLYITFYTILNSSRSEYVIGLV